MGGVWAAEFIDTQILNFNLFLSAFFFLAGYFVELGNFTKKHFSTYFKPHEVIYTVRDIYFISKLNINP
jgi:hypothetical protein